MAYFGGTVSVRPWSKIDLRFTIIFVFSFLGIAASILLVRDLPIFQRETPRQLSSAALTMQRTDSETHRVAVPMLIATEDIQAGSHLTASMFRLEARATEGLERHTIQDLDEIADTFTRIGIVANTPLLRTALSKTPVARDITNRIPAGFRAVAIPVNVLTGVEGWVRPGATVDVIWSTEHDHNLIVSTIVENAKVLSVERSLDPETHSKSPLSSIPNHITLLVPYADAQKIQLAKASGSLNLSLRGNTDGALVGTDILTSHSLLARRDPRSEIKGRVTIDGEEYVLQEQGLILRRDLERTSVTQGAL